MAKLKEMLIDIQEMLVSGYSIDEIMEKTGMPLDFILQVERSMESYVMENDYDDGQPDEAQEWADYDPDC
jgi:hypothetical protein